MTYRSPGSPLISVVTPVYNAAPFLAASIDSILAQSYPHIELIVVVDEGSTDGSVTVARELAQKDARIRLIELPRCSRAYARNIGASAARGEWLAWQDADDIASPERLAAQLAWMRQNSLDLCGSCLKNFGGADGLIWFPETHDAICAEMLFRTGLLLATAMVRTEVVRAYPFDVATAYEEYEWYTRLIPHYRLGNVPRILLQERSHSGQSHMREGSLFQQDQRRYRQPYFFQRYPTATPQDYSALVCVLDRVPCTNLSELRRAGEWLVRLADVEDAFLRARMAQRWRATALRSAFFGFGAYQVYKQLLPEFRAAPNQGNGLFWLACALRLRNGSRVDAIWASIRRKVLR